MIVALLNQKGGVGKTTLALHLAGEWARQGQRVTLVDADPQGSALDWSQQRAREGLSRLFGVVGLARDTLHISDGRAIHPTERATALIEILARASCPPGGVVGDWFAGSDATGEACRLSGRRHLGCEIDLETAEHAPSRITALLPFLDGGAA